MKNDPLKGGGAVIRATSPRWARLIAWALRVRSPSRGGCYTLREAWTGELGPLDKAIKDGLRWL